MLKQLIILRQSHSFCDLVFCSGFKCRAIELHITKVADCLLEKEINARDMSPKLLLLSAASDSIIKRQKKKEKKGTIPA